MCIYLFIYIINFTLKKSKKLGIIIINYIGKIIYIIFRMKKKFTPCFISHKRHKFAVVLQQPRHEIS